MKPSELSSVLQDLIINKEPMLLVGAPGVGKTDIVKQVCEKLGADLIISHPAVSDPTDYKGFPMREKDGTHAVFIPFGETWKAINANKLTVWFLDDLGQASEAVQKALMQLLLGRRLNGHKLSDDVVFIAATNDVGHKAGVTGLIEPVKSRFTSIINFDVSWEDWCAWALSNGMPVELIAHIRNRPDRLSAFQPTREIKNSPSPRGWASIGRLLNRGIKNYELYKGAIGQADATEFLSFLELSEKLPSLDKIIMDPEKQLVPEEPSLRWMVSYGLAMRSDKKNFGQIYIYLNRLPQSFRVLSIKTSINLGKNIHESEAFLTWQLHEGKEIFEMEE